jgi:hypothetical protein
VTLKGMEKVIRDYLPKLDFYKPKGIPHGAKWEIKPDPKKDFAIKYEETTDLEDGYFTYTATMPFELTLTVRQKWEQEKLGKPDNTLSYEAN